MSTKSTPVRVIVETISSARDVNGNCYHFARFYNPAKGRQASVAMEVHSGSNARHLAFRMTQDWEAVLAFEATLPKREWKRVRPENGLCEGFETARIALADLFDLTNAQAAALWQ